MKSLNHWIFVLFLSWFAFIPAHGSAAGGVSGKDTAMSDTGENPPRSDYRMSEEKNINKPLEKEGAEKILQDMLTSGPDPNLKVGRIEDKGAYYEAEIVTRNSGSLVDRVTVNKATGRVRPAY